MKHQSQLDQLCTAYGISLDYSDIWGGSHATSDATKQGLLAGMGVPAGSPAEVRRSLEDFEAARWQRRLPPVVVMRENALAPIVLTLPAGHSKTRIKWSLKLENGGVMGGKILPGELELIEHGTLGDTLYHRYAMPLPGSPGVGYHRFELDGDSLTLVVAPADCYQPEAIMGEGKVWGPAAQLYSLRSQRNWGIGDFGDLKSLLKFCGDQGAGVVGLNPIHALFPENPQHACPYAPSSRLFLNPLYLDVEAIEDFNECKAVREAVDAPEFQAQLRALRSENQVQYAKVAEAKFPVFEQLYGHFREQHLKNHGARAAEFREFQSRRGEALRRLALFEALQAHFRKEDESVWGWTEWPQAYRNPASDEVALFCDENLVRVEFYEYLQWQAALQLRAAGYRSKELGLGVGMLLDLAVSVCRGGADVWSNQALYASAATIGAPPDDFSLHGQNWGLPPLVPHHLRESGYAHFIATLREIMRDAGALRIDHVMGLVRLFWIPAGSDPENGAYVSYPLDDLLGIVAMESRRNRCLVIGEDLGTVEESLRAELNRLGVLSYRVFYFEKDPEGSFKAPTNYPSQALAAVSTHDLATLSGYWQGTDLAIRDKLGLFPSEPQREQQIVSRAEDRARLLVALERESLLPAGVVANPASMPEMNAELIQAVHAYLARSAAKLMLVQLEDVFGLADQPNLPGTSDQHPNWKHKLPLNFEEWEQYPRVAGMMETLRRERGMSIRTQNRLLRQEAALPMVRIPRATYRLQFNREFTFVRATELVPYLSDLGISHCYASPYLKARPGSPHGYDIIDHNALNPEIGSPEDFERFVAALHEHQMGQILDMVPNHMGVMGADNGWWLDVLENGQASAYARFFDIDWFPVKAELQGKVLLPVLGKHFGAVLEAGELRLSYDRESGSFSIFYFEHRFPVDPREYPKILGFRVETLAARMSSDDVQLSLFQSLVTACGHLPARSEVTPEKIAERQRDKELLKRNLAAVCAASPDISRFVDENLAEFNGVQGDPTSYDLLHGLLDAQAYRLAFWRVAADEINYRRFFDINELAALSMENQEVFEETHRFVFDLISKGKIDGLRIDHPDGLHDPAQYFSRLQEQAGGQGDARPLYLVIEKITAAFESLPGHWRVYGTTGYKFLNQVNGLMIKESSCARMTHIYQRLGGGTRDFSELVYSCKRLIMKSSMSSELNVLATQLSRIAEADIHTCDYTLNGLRYALAEVIACFPVYRTYVTGAGASAEDTRYVDWAIALAKKRNQAGDVGIYNFVREVLLTGIAAGKSDAYRQAVITFAMKFQQYTAPVMAKGYEDTFFYQYDRLVSLNEVGGDPSRYSISFDAFHRACQENFRDWPHGLLATSTHDSKRSEDVRARINVLSEIPDEWDMQVRRWKRLNHMRKTRTGSDVYPTSNDEFLLYQTLLGTWPLEEMDESGRADYCARIESYMLKAAREAKTNTSWINPNEEYERALSEFVRALLTPPGNELFMRAFLPLQERVARNGMFNSLSQTLLKLTAPGVPDIYPGCELWDFSLVDPDNRRPVDFARRENGLAEMRSFFAAEKREVAEYARGLLQSMGDGRIKLYLIWKTLSFRREQETLFGGGDYVPLKVEGEHAEHVCAFARVSGNDAMIAIVPRWFDALTRGENAVPLGRETWKNTRVVVSFATSVESWINLFTEEEVACRRADPVASLDVAEILSDFPCALLSGRPA